MIARNARSSLSHGVPSGRWGDGFMGLEYGEFDNGLLCVAVDFLGMNFLCSCYNKRVRMAVSRNL